MEPELKDDQWAGQAEGEIPPGPYGLMDTKDGTWIGNDDGPLVYADWGIARVAAEVLDVQLRYEPGRIRARTFNCPNPRLVETLETVMGPEEALRGLEEGRFL